MESTKRKPTEDARRTKTPKLPAIVAIEKKIEALREEIVMVSATAGLARVSLNDVQRQFGSHPTLKGHLSDLDDLDSSQTASGSTSRGA